MARPAFGRDVTKARSRPATQSPERPHVVLRGAARRTTAPGPHDPSAADLLLPDLILAEVACVLESFYELPRTQVAMTLRAVLAFPAIRVVDADLLERAVEVYEINRLDFADACLLASADRTGVGVIASFNRGIDRVATVRREEPA